LVFFHSQSVLLLERLICLSLKKVSVIFLVKCFLANKDEEGKPIVGPRNFTTKPLKKGKTENVYFARASSYTAIGDPYKEPGLAMRTSVKDGHLKAGHDKAFIPTKHVK